jgi:Insertion element 4 transposase N-terminal
LMILLQSALRETLPRVPDRLGKLIALIDPSWIEQAPAASGKASIMRRKLPAEHTVWLVIGLALFRNCLLWQVVQQLELSLGAQLQDEDHALTLFDRADFSGQPIAVNSK